MNNVALLDSVIIKAVTLADEPCFIGSQRDRILEIIADLQELKARNKPRRAKTSG